MTPEEKEAPELLIKSPSRRRRIAEGSGSTEQQVAEMMSAFTAMRSQTMRMGKMMAMGKKDGATDKQLMEDLVKSVQVGGLGRQRAGLAHSSRQACTSPPALSCGHPA
jgi:signal recognition particle GTPase